MRVEITGTSQASGSISATGIPSILPDLVWILGSATTSTWKDASGAKQERTEWHDIVAWEKLAQICGEYLHKGKMVYVEGSLQTRSWEDQNGQKRYKTEVKASNVVMLSRREDGARASASGTPAREVADASEAPVASGATYDDDVPF